MRSILTHTAFVTFAVLAAPSAAQAPNRTAVPREINITADSAKGWLPGEELDRSVREAFDRYFAAVDSGSYRKAYDMMSDTNKAMLPYDQFARQSEQFQAKAGPLRRRSVLKITWTKDSASAPYPGVYAAVDETATFRNVDRQCGYIVFYQRPAGGDLQVMRVEYNFIDNTSAANIAQTQSAAELDRTWTALSANCPNFRAAAIERPQTERAPLPEAPTSTIGYPSVAAAMKALHAQPNVVFTSENGWIITTDEAAYTVWSFTPPSYPAYPAVVKRQVVSEATGSSILTNVQCEASKSACDDLVRTFSQMNEMVVPQ
jgi:hypothetical protein